MTDLTNFDVWARMLRTVAERIRQEQETLSTLDAATGDGDHGAAMRKVADAIATTVDADDGQDMKKLFADLGWAAMGTDAGSTGPLYGAFFLGMSEGVDGSPELTPTCLVQMLEAGLANLQKNTRAKPGDKTMIDAMVPAVEAMRAAADGGADLADVLQAGADAAAQGAEATKQMQAAFGRARNIGERSLGHMDPGAASMSLVFAGLKKGFTHG